MMVRKSIWIPVVVLFGGVFLAGFVLDASQQERDQREKCVQDMQIRTGRLLEWNDPCHLAHTVVPQIDAMRDVLQAHLERYWDCRDIGVAARGTEAWDDINHECRQAAYVEDWRDLEAEYERLRSQVNPHWEPLDWYATYVEPQSRTLPKTEPTTTTAPMTTTSAVGWTPENCDFLTEDGQCLIPRNDDAPPTLTTTTPKQECLHRNVTATMLGDPEIWWSWNYAEYDDEHYDMLARAARLRGESVTSQELKAQNDRCIRGDRCYWLGHPDLGGDGLTYQTWYCDRLYGSDYDYLGPEYDYLKWDRRTGCPIEEIVPAMPGDEDCLYD